MTPDEPTTQELRALFSERADVEAQRATQEQEDEARRAAERRADKASYLEDKLAEQERSEGD